MGRKLLDKSAIELKLQDAAGKIELLKNNLEQFDDFSQFQLSISIMRVISDYDFIMACRWDHEYIEMLTMYVSEINKIQKAVIDRLKQSDNMLDEFWVQLIDRLNIENETIHKNIQTIEILNEILTGVEKILPPKSIWCVTSEEFVNIREKVNPDEPYLKSNLEKEINLARERLRSGLNGLNGISSKREPARKYFLEVIKKVVSNLQDALKIRVDSQVRIYVEQKILSTYNQVLKESILLPQYNIEESEIRKLFLKDAQEIYKIADVSYPLASQSYYDDLAKAIAIADIKTHVFDSDEFRLFRTKDREEKIHQYTDWIFMGVSHRCHEYLLKIFEIETDAGSQYNSSSSSGDDYASGLPYYVINDWAY